MSALTGIRIVELAESVAGEYCGKLLADFGAEVIKIERPGGSPTRAMAPLVGDGGGPERSAVFAYLNTNKRSVELDVTSADQLELLHTIIATADAVIDDHAPSWATRWACRSEVARRHPTVVFCSVTPYGMQAPPELHNAKSLNVFHSSGWGLHTPSHADPAKPPLKGPGRFLADYEAGLDAALCVASSLFWHLHTGAGQVHRRVRARGAGVARRLRAGQVHHRRDRAGEHPRRLRPARPRLLFRLRGRIRLSLHDQRQSLGRSEKADGPTGLARRVRGRLARVLGHPGKGGDISATDSPHGSASSARTRHPKRPSGWAFRWCRSKSAADLKNSPQYRHRGFFHDVTHPVLGSAAYPGVPYLLSASPARIISAAPTLGEHTDEIRRSIETPRATPTVKSPQLKPPKVSARRPAGRRADRRAHQGVGRSIRRQAAGVPGRRGDQGGKLEPP